MTDSEMLRESGIRISERSVPALKSAISKLTREELRVVMEATIWMFLRDFVVRPSVWGVYLVSASALVYWVLKTVLG